jgi:thiamine transport system permease protein
MTVLYSRLNGARAVPLAPRLRGEGLRLPRGWRQRLLVGAVVVTLLVLLVSPLAALTVRSFTRLDANRGERTAVTAGWTLDYYREMFINRRQTLFYVPPIDAMRNSLLYAGVTVIISLSMGLMAAAALQRKLRVNRWIDALLMLPLGTSAVTLGLGFLVVFNRPPLDVRSFPLLIPFAHSLVALPFVVRTIQPALSSIPVSLRQAAAVMGASPLRVWLEVDLPIIARAVLAGAVFAFTVSLGEFGATSFLARPEYPTLPIAIYRFLSQPGALNYGQALAMATLLMAVCAVSILIMERLLPDGADFV